MIHKFFLINILIIIILIATHYFSINFPNLHIGFNLDGEANVPSWYSTIMLFSISLISLYMYFKRFYGYIYRRFWMFYSCVFCFLSLDEAARCHEFISLVTSIKWVYIYIPFYIIFYFICFYHMTKLNSPKFFRLLLLGLLIFGCGGILFEFISYLYFPLSSKLQQIEYVLEEGLEMLGVLMILTGFLNEMINKNKNVSFLN